MAYNPNQPRNVKGAPMAGAWKEDNLRAGAVVQEAVARAHDYNERLNVDKQVRILEGAGYVEARAQFSYTDPEYTRGIESWHGQAIDAAPFQSKYPVIPDDYGSTTEGRSLNNMRRAPRMKYAASDGTTLRMMSATRLRKYAKQAGVGKPFLVPVEASIGGKKTIGYVRVMDRGHGVYSAVPEPGFPKEAAAKVGESVSAVMEARRVRTALDDMDKIVANRQQKMHRAGVMLKPVDSDFIAGAGYNNRSGEMTLQMRTTKGELRSYAYQNVHPDLWRQFEADPNPGKAYNRLIKGVVGAAVKDVAECGKCGAFHTAGRRHVCLSRATPQPYQKRESLNQTLDISAMAGAERAAITGRLESDLERMRQSEPAEKPRRAASQRRR